MGFNCVVWLLIGVFLLLFGLTTVTTIAVEFGRPIMGYCALIAGICCILQCVFGIRRPPPPPQ